VAKDRLAYFSLHAHVRDSFTGDFPG